MKTLKTIITASFLLFFAGCQADDGKAPLDPPEMIDSDGEKDDWVSYFTDVVGEFKYYGETITGDFLPRGFVGYTFTGKGGEIVTIEVEALRHNRDTVLFLYPPLDTDDPWAEIWRSPMAENDDIDWPDNTNSAIRDITLPMDGAYLVVVAEYRGRGGSFTTTLLCSGGGCENSAPFCGGIAGLPCPEGQYCKLDGDYPDAGGHCILDGKCEVPADCDAQGLYHPMCVGSWQCNRDSGSELGMCSWNCGYEPLNDCEIRGGSCGYFLDGCGDGFESFMGEPWGCPGGRSGICCLPEDFAVYACQTDDDCILASADCCGCQSGGSSVAVNVNYTHMVGPDPAECTDVMCTMVYMCFGRAACVSNQCTHVTD